MSNLKKAKNFYLNFLKQQKIKGEPFYDKIGQLNKVESIKNKVGFSERTDVVIEPRISTQWFMKMENLAKPALKSVLNQSVNFYPKFFIAFIFKKVVKQENLVL